MVLQVLSERFISLHKKSPYFLYKERDLIEDVI